MTTYFARGSASASLGIDDFRAAFVQTFEQIGQPQRALLLPPDATRFFSRGGELTVLCHELLGDRIADIMPALGTHRAMSGEELDRMFPGVPHTLFRPHRWREDVVTVGEIPSDFVSSCTGGKFVKPWKAQVNRLLLEGGHDLILSLGQVVPHEVVGMANYNKNVFIGTGGKDGINDSHYLSAVCGIDQTLGRADTPLRRILNRAHESFCSEMPLLFALTVVESLPNGSTETRGLFIGDDHETFERAAELSSQVNIYDLDEAPEHVVAYLDPSEFKSTWLGNKAIYRTRLAVANGGRLTVLAPNVSRFGEDDEIDRLIRKYGYRPSEEVRRLFETHDDLAANPSAAAHLVHGCPEHRFQVVYAAGKLTPEEVRGVHFDSADLGEMMKRYDVERLEDGWNFDPQDGSKFYFVRNPALGLWRAQRERM